MMIMQLDFIIALAGIFGILIGFFQGFYSLMNHMNDKEDIE